MQLTLLLTLVIVTTSTSAQSRLSEAIAIFNEGKEFYEDGNYNAYLKKSLDAHELLPFSRSVKYNLAAAYASNGQYKNSFRVIDELIQIDNRIRFDADSVFSKLKSIPDYLSYLRGAAKMNDVIAKSEVAFELNQIDLHPESIAYSEVTGLFYIGSMRKRKIVTYDPKSKLVSDWITTDDFYDLYGVMGMKVSSDAQSLWFCSSPMPQMEGYTEKGQYTPSIFKVQLNDKNKVDRFALPIGSVPGDLVLSPTGTCYVSDSGIPRVFRIVDNQARLFFDGSQSLVNLQGLALNGNFLFIADYLLGIHRLTISDKSLIPLTISSPHNTAGSDGIYYYNNSLIAIQNGVYPFRIARYFLEDHKSVVKFEYYEKASDYLDEPTLGVILNDEFYFVANSPWGHYEKGTLLVEYLRKPQIRRATLELEEAKY